jgi:Undecaprenyl-phosphate glucose phosphotransferase
MALAGMHAAIAVWTRAAHRAGVFSETIVLVGATEAAERVAQRVGKSGEARVVAIVDDRLQRAPHLVGAVPVGGSVEDLLAWEGLPHVDRIVITVTQKAETRVRGIIQRLRVIPNRVDLLMDVDTFNVRGNGASRFAGAALACVSGRPHNHARVLIKRTEDVVLASLLLVLFALPMLFIALAVKFDSQGPVIYRQRRHGFNNRVITLLKFRTMRHEPDAPLRQVCADDPRITRIGRFLRRTSLDELPQLINVLKGDMSLVGPRPHAIGMKAAERELEDIVAEYAHRHRVKPGITGWAQVNGSRGPLETPGAVRQRVRYDLEYVAKSSLWFDLQILTRTAPILLGDVRATR